MGTLPLSQNALEQGSDPHPPKGSLELHHRKDLRIVWPPLSYLNIGLHLQIDSAFMFSQLGPFFWLFHDHAAATL